MTSFLEDLKKNIQCEILSDDSHLKTYQTDESIFKILPTVIVFPQNEQDVQTVVQIASQYQVPITARGGGSGVAGQSIGRGIILDFSKHMNQILDVSKNHAVVQPGVVLSSLNEKTLKFGSKFGPDPGSVDRCTLGGMIANNAAGPHALVFGSTRDHIQSLNLVLSNGQSTNSQTLAGNMKAYVEHIKQHAGLIRSSKRNVDKNSSGYFLDGLLDTPPAFEKLIVGSEGTLALVTQSTLKLVPLQEKISFAVFGFESMGKALMNVKSLRESKACCIELMDQTILNVVQKENPRLVQELQLENASASLWVEWNGEVPNEWKSKTTFTTSNKDEIRRIWGERSKVSKWLHAQAESQNRKPLRCIEDACVPIDRLVTYVMELNDLLERHDCKGAIFGHVGNGHLHVNPAIRIDVPDLEHRIQLLMDEFYDLVLDVGGTISGEHGDGILRVPYARKQWKDLWPLFEFVKKSFDPKGIFNPDKKVPFQSANWPELKY